MRIAIAKYYSRISPRSFPSEFVFFAWAMSGPPVGSPYYLSFSLSFIPLTFRLLFNGCTCGEFVSTDLGPSEHPA